MELKPGKSIHLIFLLLWMLSGTQIVSAQDSLQFAIDTTEVDSVRLELMMELADQYSRMDENDLAARYYRDAISLASEIEHQLQRAIALDKLGTHVRRTGLYDQSLEYHEQALEIVNELGDKHLQSSIYNHIGVVYRRKSEDNLALKFHLMALRIAEETSDLRNISYACNSIGIIYTYQKDFGEALDYFNRAMKISKQRDNQTGLAINLNSVAWVYELQEKYDSAIIYYERSLEVNRMAGNLRGMAICYNDLGKLYRTIGDYDRSLDYYDTTLEIYEETGDRMHIAINRINVGQVYADLGDYDRSLRELNTGLELARELGLKREMMNGYDQLARTHEKKGDLQSAIQFIRQYAAYRDSIYDEESARQIAEFKTLFDTEQKEKENIVLAAEKQALDGKVHRQRLTVLAISSFLLLVTGLAIYLVVIRRKLLLYQKQIRSQNEQLVRNEKKLNEMIATKDKFFKIVAHDLRNHFNVLMGFSNLLRQTHKEVDVDERDEMISNISDISKETYSLMENLLLWSRSQTEKLPFSPKQHNLSVLVDANLDTLMFMAKSKNLLLKREINDELKVFADQEMLNTILRNLVMNAIKFSHEGGQIVISGEPEEAHVKVAVHDEGKGMDRDQVESLFDITKKSSSRGTNNEKGTGLGLMLCKEFIEKHRGTIYVESELGKGSTFYFTLPSEATD